ncbi:hypothetical protein BSKO_13455 [Bryopsis sp. KO-2023]|nr:hypothetical protein BSKO_13455 [Bryopsis sp. KO-2023]
MRFFPFLVLFLAFSAAQDTTRAPCERSTCLVGASAGCGGACFIDVAAETNDFDRETESLGLLCSEECVAGWSSDATLDCLRNEQTEFSLGVLELVERLTKEVCPLVCSVDVVPPEIEEDCLANETCSERCKTALLNLSRPCRNVLVRSKNPDFKEAALRIFTGCGVEFDLEVEALEPTESPSKEGGIDE